MLDEFVATEIRRVARLHVANICQHHHAYTTTCFVTPKRVYGIGGGQKWDEVNHLSTVSPPRAILLRRRLSVVVVYSSRPVRH